MKWMHTTFEMLSPNYYHLNSCLPVQSTLCVSNKDFNLVEKPGEQIFTVISFVYLATWESALGT